MVSKDMRTRQYHMVHPALKGGTALGFCFSTLIKRRRGRYSDLEMVVGWEAARFIVMTKEMYTTD